MTGQGVHYTTDCLRVKHKMLLTAESGRSTMDGMTADEIVRRLAPSDAELARMLTRQAASEGLGSRITPQGVRAWRVRGVIPWHRHAQILALAKGRRLGIKKRHLEALA